MRNRVAIALLLGIALAAVAVVVGPVGRTTGAEKARRYVCTPCGMACDKKFFDHPGKCPDCGGRLIGQGASGASRKTAAILIFDGVDIIDYTGPYEVFGQGGFEVFTVAETKGTVTTSMGMKVIPQHTFADAPPPDVLVVPGGNVKGPRASVL